MRCLEVTYVRHVANYNYCFDIYSHTVDLDLTSIAEKMEHFYRKIDNHGCIRMRNS